MTPQSVAAGLFSTGRYAGSMVSAILLAAILGDGSSNAGTLFAITTAAAAGAALLALRLGPPRGGGAPAPVES